MKFFFFKNIKMLKKKSIFFFNILFENFGLFFIQFHFKKKRIAKYMEIVPKLLTNHQSIMRTLSFLKKYWKLFSLDKHIFLRQRELFHEIIYKNNLNYTRWR